MANYKKNMESTIMTTNIRAVIFDMDGTLIDNISFHKDAWLIFLKKYNIYIDPDQFQAQNHGTIDEMIKRFFGNNVDFAKLKALGQEKEKTYRDLYRDKIKEINGLSAFLGKLKTQGIKIGLATNCDMTNIDFVLENLKIKNYFDIITGGHEVNIGKPHPEIFITTLKKLNVVNHDTIVFEDSEGGIIASRKAGIKVVGITTSFSADELKAYGCFEVIDDYKCFDKNN